MTLPGYRFALTATGGAIASVTRQATRRLAGAALLPGRTATDALDLASTLFAACPLAQEIALARALEAAIGQPAPRSVEAARELLLLAEAVAGHAFTLLAIWPRHLGQPPVARPLAACLDTANQLAAALFTNSRPGTPSGHLKPSLTAGSEAAAALRNAAASAASAAALLPYPAAPSGQPPPPLPDLKAAWFHTALAREGFAATPSIDGIAHEPGPLARLPQTGRAARLLASGATDAARLLARRAELEAIAAGADPLPPSSTHAEGPTATAVVETARGPLAVHLTLQDGSIARYASAAPTEWQLHPQGALTQALVGLAADDTLPTRAGAALAALDPCCPCTVTLAGRMVAEHA